ncbi:hypothetical protein BH11BAC2_BH11BAC2_25770 [soil metagenome]
MDGEDIVKKGLLFILKLIWKVCLILVWGTLRLVEVILSHINTFLKQFIKT